MKTKRLYKVMLMTAIVCIALCIVKVALEIHILLFP